MNVLISHVFESHPSKMSVIDIDIRARYPIVHDSNVLLLGKSRLKLNMIIVMCPDNTFFHIIT